MSNNDNFKTKVIGELKYFPKTNITREQEAKVKSALYKLPYIAICEKCRSVILCGKDCKIGVASYYNGNKYFVIICPKCEKRYDNISYGAIDHGLVFPFTVENKNDYFDCAEKIYGRIDISLYEAAVKNLLDYHNGLLDFDEYIKYDKTPTEICNDIINSSKLPEDIGKADDQMMLYAATHRDILRSTPLKNFKSDKKLDYTANQYTNDDNTHEETSINKSNKIEYISESLMRGKYRIKYCLNPSGIFEVIDTSCGLYKVVLDMKDILYIAGNVIKYEKIKEIREEETKNIKEYNNMHPYNILGLDIPIKNNNEHKNKDTKVIKNRELNIPNMCLYTEAFIVKYSCSIDGRFDIIDITTKDYIVGFDMKDILYIASQVLKAQEINRIHEVANNSIKSLKERNPYDILGIKDLIENINKED